MNCNLTDEERKTKKARCRSWDCSGCNNFYSNCLNEEINNQEKKIAELKTKLKTAIKALEFYASENSYQFYPASSDPECMQCVGFIQEGEAGDSARQALKEINNE